MDKPLCRICRTKHWGNEPHKFGTTGSSSAQQSASRSRDSGGAAVRPGSPAVSVKGGDSVTSDEKLEAAISRVEKLVEQDEKRRAWKRKYMREYMRKYRERKG